MIERLHVFYILNETTMEQTLEAHRITFQAIASGSLIVRLYDGNGTLTDSYMYRQYEHVHRIITTGGAP